MDGAQLPQEVGTVASDKKKLDADLAAAMVTRTNFDLGVRSLATLAEAAATSVSDLQSLGFTPRTRAPIPTGAPPPPDSITVKMPKRHGFPAHATAVYSGSGRPHFVAQQSPDPIGPSTWIPLVGAGRARALPGASGTHVWVRFATVRGVLQRRVRARARRAPVAPDAPDPLCSEPGTWHGLGLGPPHAKLARSWFVVPRDGGCPRPPSLG